VNDGAFDLRQGDSVGPYRLTGVLGRGGMGIVFRGAHAETGDLVAIKTVRVPTSQHLTGLRREIRALSRLRHPGIVRIVDHGVANGLPWYAMELLEGTTLADLLEPGAFSASLASTQYPRNSVAGQLGRAPTLLDDGARLAVANGEAPEGESQQEGRGGLAIPLVARILRSVCETLSHLHENGFVHRDLKPSNIFVDQLGNTILVDFGVAGQFAGAGGKEKVELVGAVVGSAAYMSPEQIRGDLVDARSDLYSIGCVLYECLTGTPPFDGSTAWDVLNSQLWSEPEAPTKRNPDTPAVLEALVLRLLAKRPQDRIGYADVVAKALAGLGAPTEASAIHPPSYLYRPSFVRRSELQATFGGLLEQLSIGAGEVLLLSGESGVGKTRAAMELAALAQRKQVTVAVGECSPAGLEAANERVLAPFRPVLQAIADACREGGAAAARELIGHRGWLLSRIEPAFIGLPAPDWFGSISAGDATPRQVLAALRDTLFAYAQRQPTLLILDDLQWADDLSLELLAELVTGQARPTPLLILGTYRPEEASEGLASLLASGHVRTLAVERLGRAQVGAMMAGMLALETAPPDLLEYVDQRAEGNPFLVAEYLMAEIENGTLRRNALGEWTLERTAMRERLSEPPGLPDRVRDIFLRRFAKLDTVAQHLATVAAVFGRELFPTWLRHAAEVGDDELIEGLQTLRRHQILDDTATGMLRFRHDQLRLCMYEAIAAEERRALHERAGGILERLEVEQGAPAQSRTLAHHHSLAQRPERAYPYFCKAAQEARAVWANGDALRHYEAALREARAAQATSPSLDWSAAMVGPFEAIGDLHAMASQRDDARTAFEKALALLPAERRAQRARLQRKMGKAWETQHAHADALRLYELALAGLGSEPPLDDPEQREEWIQVQVEKLWVYYWQNQIAAMDDAIQQLRPLIDKFANAYQRARVFQTQMLFGFRRDRYLVNEETLRYARAAVDACREADAQAELPAAQMAYGLALVVQGSLDLANTELTAVAEFAHRAGDNALQARCLTYLGMCARMRRRFAEVSEYARRTKESAGASAMVEYLAAADANEAWLCLREGEAETSRTFARRALERWKERIYPFKWLALLPLLEVELHHGELGLAVECAEQLLAPTQQFLPGAAADAFGRAVKTWSLADLDGTRAALSSGLNALAVTGYW
jgi:eukaryotic-like serine/threonine-protein kinase